jgi:hypothetical protein
VPTLKLVWNARNRVYVEADDPRWDRDSGVIHAGCHWHTVEEAQSVAGEDGVVIVGGPLA